MKRFFILGAYSPSLQNFRGALIEAVQARGYGVEACAPGLSDDDATRDWLVERGVQPHDLALARTGLNPASDLRTLLQLWRKLRRLKPDLFFGYTIKPVIWGLLAAWLARVPGRVALITGLGYAFTGQARGKRALLQGLARLLYKIALSRATLILFQNDDDRALFQAQKLLPARVPVEVVNGSGVDIQHFAVAPLPDGAPTFLLIARLLGDKGIREYQQAAKALRQAWPQAQFHLVGGIDTNPNAIRQDEVEGWQQDGSLTWLGPLTDVRPAIAAAHVYVLPSYREGTPRTVLEAMAMGRAIVTTDAPGCRQTVEDGVNGYKVPVADAEALRAAMEAFLKEPALVAGMGQASRAIAEQKYDVHKVNAVILTAMGI